MAGKAWMLNEDGGAPQYHAAELRRLLSPLMFGGVADLLGARSGVRPHPTPVVSLSGGTVTVAPHAGVVYPGLSSTDGPYLYELPVAEPHPLDPADGSQSRVDLIVVRIYDDAVDSSGELEAVSEYVPGTPGAGAPSVPSSAMEVARVTVPQTGGGDPSLEVTAPWTVAAGGILPVADGSALPTVGRHAGMYADNADTGELLRFNGTDWEPVASPLLLNPPRARRSKGGSQAIPSGTATVVTTPTVDYREGIDNLSGSEGFRIARAGIYQVTWQVRLANGTSGRRILGLQINGSWESRHEWSAVTRAEGTGVFEGHLDVNDELRLVAFQDSGSAINATSDVNGLIYLAARMVAETPA